MKEFLLVQGWRPRLLTGLGWFISRGELSLRAVQIGYPSCAEKFVAWGYPAWFTRVIGGIVTYLEDPQTYGAQVELTP